MFNLLEIMVEYFGFWRFKGGKFEKCCNIDSGMMLLFNDIIWIYVLFICVFFWDNFNYGYDSRR